MRLSGASWLVEPVGSSLRFTGGDFGDDDLYAKTAEDFVRSEVLPRLEEIETKKDGVMPALAFLLGRTVARAWVSSRVAANARVAAIDRAVGREGLKIVLLTRLSPVFPFNLLNYAFGLAQVSLRDYVLGSLVGMLPGTLMYVYLGSLITSLSELASGRASGGHATGSSTSPALRRPWPSPST